MNQEVTKHGNAQRVLVDAVGGLYTLNSAAGVSLVDIPLACLGVDDCGFSAIDDVRFKVMG
jgi:hypothetical protein